MRRLLPLVLSFVFVVSLIGQTSTNHFYFSGPLTKIVADGVKVAPVTAGVPFSIELTEAGAKISPSRLDLALGSGATAKLQFSGLKFATGHLTGTAAIKNSIDAPVEGVRLDIVSVVETFKSKDATATRTQPAHAASPLFFGDLGKGETSDTVSLDVGPITFAPETTKVTINGVVSGMLFVGAFNIPDVNDPKQIDVDRQGRLYVCDTTGKRVLRTDAEGQHVETVATLEDQCLSTAVDPVSGDVYAVRGNADSVYMFSPTGEAKGSFPGGDYVDLAYLRFDKAGRLHSSGSHVFRFQGQKAILNIKDAAGQELSAKGFDVDTSGNIWVVSGLEDKRSIFRIGSDGRSALLIGSGLDWRLGGPEVPATVRVDSAGNAYIAELGQEGVEAARISVFDKDGRFVRAFGRGGRVGDPDADKLLPGQIYRPKDIAFGLDGRIYIAGENDGGFKENLMLVFKPF